MDLLQIENVVRELQKLLEKHVALSNECRKIIDVQTRAICMAIERLAQIANNNSSIKNDKTIARKCLEDIRAIFLNEMRCL